MILVTVLSLLMGGSSFTNIDPPLKIDGGEGPELKLMTEPLGHSKVRGSGWLVLERANVSFAVAPDADNAMMHVIIECPGKASRCFITYTIAGRRNEKESFKRLSTTRVATLKIVQRSEKKIVAERKGECERDRWTLDLKAQRVVLETRNDPNGDSEMGACPKGIKVDAHLGSFEEASRIFHARNPATADFKAAVVPSDAPPSPIEIVEGENPSALAWKEPKDEGLGASGWMIVDESNAGDKVLTYARSILKAVSIQCEKKECMVAEAKVFKAADNPARQLVGSELHFAKVLEWDAAHAIIEQPVSCARLLWTVTFKDQRMTLAAAHDSAAPAGAACPQELKLSGHLGTFKDAVAGFRSAGAVDTTR